MHRIVWLLVVCFSLVWLGTASTSAQAATTTSSKLNISIDGDFSDWDDKPMTTLANDEKASLIADDSAVYLYMNTNPNDSKHGAVWLPDSYTLKVGSKSFTLTLGKAQGLGAGKTKSVTVSANGDVVSGGSATISRPKDSHGNYEIVEMRVPLSGLGVVATSSQNISLTSSDSAFGGKTLTTTGGSTGGVILVAAGFSIALVGVMKVARRRRKVV
ncbi:Firmicu-CTERM sorting domain-containing protein [Levilactobacillus sp. HBUAS70063]|uniref:Firmicu-CTERM sorting domain-containing protein n=1 Tax=Levilactobacillus sp. HBUAS70063 TaxID=3109359 RepID=UPI0031332936